MRSKPFRLHLVASPLDASDEARFDALVRAEYTHLVTFVRRYVRSRDLAEDLVQDVFAGVWKHIQRFDYDDPLPYLYRAARNRAISHLRHEQVRGGWLRRIRGAPEPVAPEAVGPETMELADAIARVVDELPERCRAVFLLSRDRGMSNPEIAQALDVSVKTVETQMGKALRTLRERLAAYVE
jgi:RNA polymerase sigma-70 factor, ECF subfamily